MKHQQGHHPGHGHHGHGPGRHGPSADQGHHDRARDHSFASQSSPAMTAESGYSGQTMPFPAPEDCPKTGGSAKCSRDCRNCPNRGL
jgi:hypothetical protein